MMPEPQMPSVQMSSLTTDQLRRAYALILVRLIWPTISPQDAMPIARWITSGTTPAGER